MTCQNCKKKIPSDSEFCQRCGKKIEKVYKPDFVIIDPWAKVKQESLERKCFIWLFVLGIAGIISWKVFNFTLPLYIAAMAFFVITTYLAYKSHELDLITWILYGGMVGGVLINFLTDAHWALYLIPASIVGLGLYGAYRQDKSMSPEEKEKIFKTEHYDLWKKQAKSEGKIIDPKEEEFYKKEHSKFNIKNTLTVILPMAIFIALRDKFGAPQAILIGLLVGGVVRFLYSHFEKK